MFLKVCLCKYSSNRRDREFPCVIPEWRVIQVDFLWVGQMYNLLESSLAAAFLHISVVVTHGDWSVILTERYIWGLQESTPAPLWWR